MSLATIVERFRHTTVVVVGDPMLDIYHFGRVERLSPEAPVPVFIEERLETRWGGAANVDQNLRALGCAVFADFPDAERWSKKHRYLAGHHPLFRVDEDEGGESQTLHHLNGVLAIAEAVVLSDYAKGWLTPTRCQWAIQVAQAKGIPVIVDPKGQDWDKYVGATVICPNEREWTQAIATADLECPFLVKRGEHGIDVMQAGAVTNVPAKARHVFDVTGAGDTVVAVVAAALATGAGLVDAARLAVLAAGHVVGEVGTATCPIEVLEALAREEDAR